MNNWKWRVVFFSNIQIPWILWETAPIVEMQGSPQSKLSHPTTLDISLDHPF